VPQTTPSNTALAAEVRLPTPVERDLFASDVLRYFLLREIPFGQDGSFSFDSMYERYNAELTNGYGNLVSRTLAMIAKYFEGSIPTSIVGTEEIKPRTLIASLISSSNDENIGYAIDIPSECSALPRVIEADFQEFGFAKLLEAVSLMISLVDGHLTTNAPWKPSRSLSDEEVRKVRADVLVTAAESIRIITALLYPILPFATARVWSQLGLGDIELAAKSGELNNLQWGGLQPGTKLGPLTPIFPRAPKELADIMSEIEDKNALETQNAKRETDKPTQPPLEPNPPAGAPALVPPTEETVKPSPITIDDFAKIELRVAQIVVAERIPKADKLLRLEVDLGYERRQILSGIAEWYTPEELLGRRIVVITNLAPRKMRGLESHGMLLAASEGEGGKPVLATFSEEIALGSRLK
jgi:methionyl-tRNA synthetase